MNRNYALDISQPYLFRFLFSDARLSWLWFAVRLYVGWEWMSSGWGKITNPVWVGEKAGIAVSGFLTNALTKTEGAHPDVSGWYAYFIKTIALPNAEIFSYMVSFGELLVGVGLILGAFTGIAAFFGAFMNMNFLWAGTVSVNPTMLIIQFFIMLAWRNAGYIGLDRFILSRFKANHKKNEQ
jgi:thiosulfate dehydrogenase (quinone) large subunit